MVQAFRQKQAKTIQTCCLGTRALKKQLKTLQASSMRKRAPTKTGKDNTNVLPGSTCSEKAATNGTSFQYEKTCTDKNQQRQYKRVAWDHML